MLFEADFEIAERLVGFGVLFQFGAFPNGGRLFTVQKFGELFFPRFVVLGCLEILGQCLKGTGIDRLRIQTQSLSDLFGVFPNFIWHLTSGNLSQTSHFFPLINFVGCSNEVQTSFGQQIRSIHQLRIA